MNIKSSVKVRVATLSAALAVIAAFPMPAQAQEGRDEQVGAAAKKSPHGEAVEGQALSLVSDKRVYAPGERVVIGIRLIDVGAADAFGSVCPISRPTLTVSSSGGPVPKTRRALAVHSDAAHVDGSGITFTLKPGESRDEQVDLNLVYDMTVAGKYRVRAKRKVQTAAGDWSPTECVSNDLEITVDDSLLSQTTGEFAARAYTIRVPRFAEHYDGNTGEVALDSIRTYRAIVADLIGQAREMRHRPGDQDIQNMLGWFRAEAAVPMLLSEIDDEPGVSMTGVKLDLVSPASSHLVSIGNPAVKPIIKELGVETSDTRRKLMVRVLRDVLGDDVADFALQRESKYATEEQKRLYAKARALLDVR